jgi:hypothetical protein
MPEHDLMTAEQLSDAVSTYTTEVPLLRNEVIVALLTLAPDLQALRQHYTVWGCEGLGVRRKN